MTKAWAVLAVGLENHDLRSGDSNTEIIKICRTKPSDEEAEKILAQWCHDDGCCEYEPEDCTICTPNPKPNTEMHDKDDFGDDEGIFGFVSEVRSIELD